MAMQEVGEPVRYVERIQAYLKIMYEEEKHYLASLSFKEFFNY
jgi:hypothetical protein